ncbi:MAG: DUF2924 domain-containing protein [Rhodospirillales bacterium]|nr:DUF2924 domain-containing protein [Rhodospirillales bacterium]
MNIATESPDVEAEIAALDNCSLHNLRKRWSRIFNNSTPKGLSRDLIVRGLAYNIQEKVHGGLSQASRRKLRTLARQLDADDRSGFDPGAMLKPGAKLIREWQARTYTVTILQDGFEFEGRRYGSLSMIAREITGVRWSGPRFFGLKNEHANAEG